MPRPLNLKERGRKAPDLGPVVQVERVRAAPETAQGGVESLINGHGFSDRDRDGLKEHDTRDTNAWQAAASPGLAIEFDLPDVVPLGGLTIWNLNTDWETTNGVRQLDVSVSEDGSQWKTVVKGVSLAEAEGTADYDQAVVLKLGGVAARKVRLENLIAMGKNAKVGLSQVVVHQATGVAAAPSMPEDGASSANASGLTLRWVRADRAKEYKVFLGADRDNLAALGTATDTRIPAGQLKPQTKYYWRVDTVAGDGKVIPGRVASFTTVASLIGWWKLDEKTGTTVTDSSGAARDGKVVGTANWQPSARAGKGALECDGQGTHVTFPVSDSFDLAETMTVVAWVKVRGFDKAWQAIASKGPNSWRLRRQAETSFLNFGCSGLAEDGESVVGATTKRKVDDGQWHHVAGVCDGSEILIYLDGKLEASNPASGQIKNNQAPLTIGKDAYSQDRSWDGWLADVRLYGCALSAEEIKTMWEAGAETQRAGR